MEHMPREVRVDRLFPDQVTQRELHQSPDQEPNCFGYALHVLGVIDVDRHVDPHGSELFDLLEMHFDRTDSVADADAIAVTYTAVLPLVDELVLFRDYYHMAVLSKQHSGYATERPGIGVEVEEVSVEEVLDPRTYAAPGVISSDLRFEPLYLRLKRQADTFDAAF